MTIVYHRHMNPGKNILEKIALAATKWIGSTQSLIVHTLLFLIAFLLVILGVGLDRVLLVLTTIVSLEAIYLSIFIQMSVNRSESRLNEVSEGIEGIQEDVDEIQENVDEIQEDVDEIQEDIGEIQEDVDEIQEDIEQEDDAAHIEHIRKTLAQLVSELEEVKRHRK